MIVPQSSCFVRGNKCCRPKLLENFSGETPPFALSFFDPLALNCTGEGGR